jgi:hypothetical protein
MNSMWFSLTCISFVSRLNNRVVVRCTAFISREKKSVPFAHYSLLAVTSCQLSYSRCHLSVFPPRRLVTSFIWDKAASPSSWPRWVRGFPADALAEKRKKVEESMEDERDQTRQVSTQMDSADQSKRTQRRQKPRKKEPNHDANRKRNARFSSEWETSNIAKVCQLFFVVASKSNMAFRHMIALVEPVDTERKKSNCMGWKSY